MKILLFILIGSHCVFGQVTNPFDIESRTDNAASRMDVSSLEAQDSVRTMPIDTHTESEVGINPFEINRNEIQKTGALDESNMVVAPIAIKRVNVYGVLFSVLSLVLLAIGMMINRARLYSMIRSVINSNYLRTLMRSTNITSDFQLFVLYAMAVLNFAIFLYIITGTNAFESITNLNPEFLIIVGICFAIYIVRHMALWFLEVIFPLGGNATIYGYSIAYHNITAGVLLLPFILGLQFGPEPAMKLLAIIGIVIFLIIYALRTLKGGILVLGIRGFNPMYFFIYLCAIEIAPVLIGLKVVFN